MARMVPITFRALGPDLLAGAGTCPHCAHVVTFRQAGRVTTPRFATVFFVCGHCTRGLCAEGTLTSPFRTSRIYPTPRRTFPEEDYPKFLPQRVAD